MKESSREKITTEGISSRLKWARKQLGLKTQAELAAKIGVKKGPISLVEAGIRHPSEAFLYKLEEKTGISRTWLLTGEGEWKAKIPWGVAESPPAYGPSVSAVMKEFAEFLAVWMRIDEERRRQALEYLRFLAEQEKGGGEPRN